MFDASNWNRLGTSGEIFLKSDGTSVFLNLTLRFSRKRSTVWLVFVLQSQDI